MNNSLSIARIGVLLAALLQVISPLFSSFANPGANNGNSDVPITPAGYAFIVWGVITLSALVYSVHQALKNRQNVALHNQIALALIIVYVLFAVWLFAASRDWLILTVLIFIVMFVFLVQTFQRLLNQQAILTSFEKIFLLGQIAIYTGWSTVALFANTASAIKFYGVTDVGQTGTIWQSLILIAALAFSAYWIRRFKANWAYVATILWALTGILVNLLRFDDFLVLKIITGIAILFVIIWAIIVRRS